MEKRIWTNAETRAFLSAYIVRKDEFLHARKKKFAMQNVLLDLESQGVLSQPTTLDMLSTKFKNLVRAYKQSADNNRRTGATPCNAPYGDLLDEIFGDSPIMTNNHSINLYGQPLRQSITPVEKDETPSTSRGPTTNSSSSQGQGITPVDEIPSTSRGPTTNSSSSQQSNGRKRRPSIKEKISLMKINAKKEAADKKLKLLEEYTNKKLEKMVEAQQLKKTRHEEKMALLKALIDSRSS